MKPKSLLLLVLAATLTSVGVAAAQSVEIFAGHQRAGVDLMWFKNFKNPQKDRSPWLFFSRNRASVAYQSPDVALFGSTNAVSYNFKNGIGLVGVGALYNTGFVPKAGVQLVKTKGDFLFFGWLVADLKRGGNLDLFGLFRYQPALRGPWRLFSQVELFPVYNPQNDYLSFTQRLRLGAKYHGWAAGFMADFNQSGTAGLASTHNLGAFLRHDF